MGLDLKVPVTFPHDLDIITVLSQDVLFLEGGLVDFIEGTICVTNRVSVALDGEALGTPVPETTVEFVHGRSVRDGITGVEPVHQVPVHQTYFTTVSYGADAITRGRVLLTQLMFLPGQPFQGLDGLVGSRPVPSARGFRGNLVLGDEFLAPESVTGRSDGDAFFHGVKLGLLTEFLAEFPTPRFQQFDVRLAVGLHFRSQDESVMGSHFFGVPSFKLGFLFGRHALRIIVGSIRHGSLVALVL